MQKEKILELKNEQEIITDSLWILGERSKDFGHKNAYHGNFIPQIPRQFIKRFTEENDVVVDAFLGSGTTLIECRELKRFGIGVELQESVIEMAKNIILQNNNGFFDNSFNLENFNLKIIQGDTASKKVFFEIENQLTNWKKKIKLLFLHPPYFDIIKFSDNKDDLSNAPNIEIFYEMMGKVIDNYLPLMEKGSHVVFVMGDKYQDSQWIPLSFGSMQEILKRKELILKSIIVKNISGNRAKISQEQLWRYRALTGGYFIFKHEYIFFFKKIK